MLSNLYHGAQREYCSANEEIISLLVWNEKVQDVSGGQTAFQSFEVLCVFAGSVGNERCNALMWPADGGNNMQCIGSSHLYIFYMIQKDQFMQLSANKIMI